MFVDLMNDIYETFTDRFLKVQLIAEEPLPTPEPLLWTPATGGPEVDGGRRAPAMRYNALGILEPVPEDEVTAGETQGTNVALDVAPAEPPKRAAAAKRDPVIVGAGKRLFDNGSKPVSFEVESQKPSGSLTALELRPREYNVGTFLG